MRPVIIGAGLGGLSCAAYLAVNGFRPLVIEKHYLPGGYATAFTRSGKDGQPYRCEVSLHATAASAPHTYNSNGTYAAKNAESVGILSLTRHSRGL